MYKRQTICRAKCGAENLEHALYCKKCGTSFKENDELRQRRRRIFVAVILFVAVVAVVSAIVLYLNHQKAADYQGKLQTADKYLQEMDCERAETAFLEAIEIDPKKEDAYLKLADVYTEQGKL